MGAQVGRSEADELCEGVGLVFVLAAHPLKAVTAKTKTASAVVVFRKVFMGSVYVRVIDSLVG